MKISKESIEKMRMEYVPYSGVCGVAALSKKYGISEQYARNLLSSSRRGKETTNVCKRQEVEKQVNGGVVMIDREEFIKTIDCAISFMQANDNDYMHGYIDGIAAVRERAKQMPEASAVVITNVVGESVVHCKDCQKRGLSLCPIPLNDDMDYCSKGRQK